MVNGYILFIYLLFGFGLISCSIFEFQICYIENGRLLLMIYSFSHYFLLLHFFAITANSSPRIFGPRQNRIEGLSLVEQNELKGAAWFQAGIPREISLEVLSRQSPGAFLVRQSSTKPGCFALSLRVPPPAPKVAHYLILRTSRGYKIKVRTSFEFVLIQDPRLFKRRSFYTKIYLLFAIAGFYERVFIVEGAHNTSFSDA